jgi:hypothetical protein
MFFMKQTNANANVNAKSSNLSKINLAQFASKLENVQLKSKKEKSVIYRYPETMKDDQKKGDEGKKFRNSLRNRLKSLCNNILYYTKTDNIEKLQENIKSFEALYKANYTLNDYSISSITNSEKREKDIELMIEIIKSVKSK